MKLQNIIKTILIKNTALCLIILSASCTGINKEETDEASIPLITKVKPAAKPVTARTNQFFRGEFSEQSAMKLLYGDFDSKKRFSIWEFSDNNDELFRTKLSTGNSLYTSAAFMHEFQIDTIPVIIVLTETSHRDNRGFPDDCHACAPILGAALFARINGAWCLQNFEKNLGEYGYWGQLPKASFIKFGYNNYGILFEINDGNQGINYGGLDILGVVNDKFRFIGSFPTWFSNEGAWKEPVRYSYEAEFSIIPDAAKEYYDISIKLYGTKPYEDKLNPGKKLKTSVFQEHRVYSFIDSSYYLTSTSLYESMDIKRKSIVSIK